MALEQKLSLYSINADCENFTLNDDTVYGAPNPDRVDVAVYVTGVKKNNDGADTPLVVLPIVADPFTVASWNVESAKDGWHVFSMYAISVWDMATAYLTGEAVYDNGIIYKALRASTNAPPSTSVNDWQTVSDLSEINDAGNIDFTLIDINIMCRSEICYSKIVSKAAIDTCTNSCDTLFGKLYREVDVLLQGANVKCQQESNADFETITRAMENVCEDYGPCAKC